MTPLPPTGIGNFDRSRKAPRKNSPSVPPLRGNARQASVGCCGEHGSIDPYSTQHQVAHMVDTAGSLRCRPWSRLSLPRHARRDGSGAYSLHTLTPPLREAYRRAVSVMFEPTSWGIAQEEGSGTGSPTLKERRPIAPHLRQSPGVHPQGVDVFALWFNRESTIVDSRLNQFLGGGPGRP